MTLLAGALSLAAAIAAALPAGAAGRHPRRLRAAAGSDQASLARSLADAMSHAGSGSGAYVVDATNGRRLYASRPGTPRVLASNTKIFTTNAFLSRFGARSTLATFALTHGTLARHGVLKGNLFLRGGGDPTFGSRSFAQSAYGSKADVEALAAKLRGDGLRRVTGAVVGDESLFDSLRNNDSPYDQVSIYLEGELSALSFDRGFADPNGSSLQSNPPLFAAERLTAALQAAGVHVDHAPGTGRTPNGALALAEVRSPTLARVVQLTLKNSDNYFAEMLEKGLAVDGQRGGPVLRAGAPWLPRPRFGGRQRGRRFTRPRSVGTTTGGAHAAAGFGRSLGAHPTLVDGSGLSRSDRDSPRDIATVLLHLRHRHTFGAFFNALPIAGVDGTLADRMQSGPAHSRCRAKTGSLSGVSALSGYCRALNGHTVVFSILMNSVDVGSARGLQDQMTEAIAGY